MACDFMRMMRTAVSVVPASPAAPVIRTLSAGATLASEPLVADFKSLLPGATTSTFAVAGTVTVYTSPVAVVKVRPVAFVDFTVPVTCGVAAAGGIGVCAGKVGIAADARATASQQFACLIALSLKYLLEIRLRAAKVA